MTTSAAAGTKDVRAVLSELRKKQNFHVGAFSEFDHMASRGLTTGNITLDALTGIGGFPSGRITELVGPPSSGKTTAALQCAAQVQQSGGVVMFLDYEQALDPEYCRSLGLDVDADTFLYAQPEFFEQGANGFRQIQADTGGVIDLVIHDSVAAMTTQHELEAETGAVQVADRAKMLYQYCRQLNPMLPRTGCAAIFLNHLLELVDTTPMGRRLAAQGIKRTTTPGGNALRYYASLRVEFKQIGNLKNEEMDVLSNEAVKQVRQTRTQVTVIKNKVADPFRTAELRVRFGKGFSQNYSVLGILTAHNKVKQAGAWFTFPAELRLNGDDDFVKLQGEDTVLTLMDEHPAWAHTLETAARDTISDAEEAFEVIPEEQIEALEAEEASVEAAGKNA